MSRFRWIGRSANSFFSSRPSLRMPVPASRTMISPPTRTSMHEVLPPCLIVSGPGVAMEPRTPQNFRRVSGLPAELPLVLGGAWPVRFAVKLARNCRMARASSDLATYSSAPDSKAAIFSALWPLPAAIRIGWRPEAPLGSASLRQERPMSDQGVCQSQRIISG